MVSQCFPVFLILAATLIKSGLSVGSMEYGLTQAEKVVKAICWYEGFKNNAAPKANCIRNVDYLQTLDWLRGRTKQRDDVLFSWLPRNITRKIQKTLPEYLPCTKYLNDRPQAIRRTRRHARMFGFKRGKSRPHMHKPINRRPTPVQKPSLPPPKSYGWLLGDDEEGDYPYRNFNHCLLGLIETKHGEQALSDLQAHWGNPESLKEEIVNEEENQGETDPEGEPEVEGQEGIEEEEFNEEFELEEIVEEEFDENDNLRKRRTHLRKKTTG